MYGFLPLPLSTYFIEGGLRFNLADVEIALGAAAVLWEALASANKKEGEGEPSP